MPRDDPHNELERWVQICVEAAENKLAKDSKAFYVGDVLGICDWFLVTSGSTERQVRAIVDAVEEALSLAGGPKPIRIEGKSELSWVLVDYGMFVVHIFTNEMREYYDLERLWSDVPMFESSPSGEITLGASATASKTVSPAQVQL